MEKGVNFGYSIISEIDALCQSELYKLWTIDINSFLAAFKVFSFLGKTICLNKLFVCFILELY